MKQAFFFKCLESRTLKLYQHKNFSGNRIQTLTIIRPNSVQKISFLVFKSVAIQQRDLHGMRLFGPWVYQHLLLYLLQSGVQVQNLFQHLAIL